MPWRSRCARGPMPESCRSCGELNAPPASITSRSARKVSVAVRTPVARRPSKVTPGRERVDEHAQIAPLFRRAQVAGGGAAATAAADGRLVVAGTSLPRAVEVGIPRHAERRGGVDEGVAELVALEVAALQRPAGAVPFIGAARLVLRFFEVGKQIAKGPARIPQPSKSCG